MEEGGTTIMMGLKERAFAPSVAVSLEELVPQDHFYRLPAPIPETILS